jgi:hypothetical protein
MAWRKYGAIRYGFIAATALVAFDQSLTASPQAVVVSVNQATLTSQGVISPVPPQRPIFQRGIRTYGILGVSGPTGTQAFSATTQAVLVSVPSATLTAGGVSPSATTQVVAVSVPTATLARTLTANPQIVVVSVPTATRSAGSASLAATQQSVVVSVPTGTLGRTLTATPQVVVVSAPTATRTTGGVALSATSQIVVVANPSASLSGGTATTPSLGLVFRRPVFQRGIRAYGPPSLSTTPELDRAFVATQQTVVVSIPAATLAQAGIQTSPVVLRPRLVHGRLAYPKRALIAGYGAVDALDSTSFTATPQVVVVSAPSATLVTAPGTPDKSPFFRLRQVVTQRRVLTRTSAVRRIERAPQSVPTPDVAFGATPQVIVVTNPDGTLLRVGGIADAPILRLRHAVARTRVQTRRSSITAFSPPTRIASTAQSFGADPQVVVVSVPTASLVGGAKNLQATPQVVVVSAPTAGLGRTLAASTQAIGVTVPAATITTGTSALLATRQAVVVTAPSARLNGATTLPSHVFEATLASRLPDHGLASRLPDYTLRVTT